MKNLKLPLIVFMSLLIMACTSDEDEELVDVVFAESAQLETIDPNDKYAFSLMGDSNIITLKGDLGEIAITGESNWVIIEEDTYIEKLTITGGSNTVEQSDDLSVTIEAIKITSDSNIITISEYLELDDAGEDNQVASTLSGETLEP